MIYKNTEHMRVVFTAQSKQFFFCRDVVCEWVLRQGCLPLNPFRVFEYFLSDRVDRALIRRGNNNLIRIADEVWVFGIVADGVLFEIEYALSLGKPLRFFNIATRASGIREIVKLDEVRFEPEIHASGVRRAELLQKIKGQVNRAQLTLFDPPSPPSNGHRPSPLAAPEPSIDSDDASDDDLSVQHDDSNKREAAGPTKSSEDHDLHISA